MFRNSLLTQTWASTALLIVCGIHAITGIGVGGERAQFRLAVRGHGRSAAAWITAVAFSPSGDIVASASHLRHIKLWDLKTGADIGTLTPLDPRDTFPVTCVAFSRDSKRLASTHGGGDIRVWDIVTRKEAFTLPAAVDLTDLSKIRAEDILNGK